VLVTGGTRGIGAAVVRRFQLAGARVVATARSASAHSMDGVLLIPADIRTAAGADSIVSRLTAARFAFNQAIRPSGHLPAAPFLLVFGIVLAHNQSRLTVSIVIGSPPV
jgi:NAD(P)-dependent dehydrogenase (short-subunit alcohol dehydrogenase family)